MSKLSELAKFLDVETEDLEESSYDESLFSLGSRDYLVYTDEEADERAKEYMRETAWAFNASFIIDHSKLPYEALEMVQGFQEKCEGANDTILALIEDFDEFVEDAISADGRGHFLSHYDSEENEISFMREDDNGIDLHEVTYYIYRTN